MKRLVIGLAVVIVVLSLGFWTFHPSEAGRYAMIGERDAVVFLDTREGDVWIWRNPGGGLAGRGDQLTYRGRLPRGVRPMQIVDFFGEEPMPPASPPATEVSSESEGSKRPYERLRDKIRRQTEALAR